MIKNKYIKRYKKQIKPKFVTKELGIICTFDKFGKPTSKRWWPNRIQKLDDFGEINYNTVNVVYRKKY